VRRHSILGLGALLLGLLVAPAGAAEVGPGTWSAQATGWAWERDGIRFELQRGDKAYTVAEADLVRDALERLPNVLLRRARDLGVTRLRRDAVPRKLIGKSANASATTVIERKWISFGDVLFRGLNRDRVYRTVAHEFGHVAQYSLLSSNRFLAKARGTYFGTPGWTSISWTLALTKGLRSWNGFVSDYARTNDREDFAESVEFYWIAPDELQKVSPTKFRFMRDRVFNQISSPATSRVPGALAIAPVKPEITSLGEQAEGPFGVVTVRGKHFMGPRDGGYNRVTFRSKKGMDLAASRTKLWAWVPSLSPGSAPVAVTTQDGKSNERTIRVKKPWWKFW